MKTYLDLADWPRREHFEFFSAFGEPFFGVTARVDCTDAYTAAKALGIPFSTYYLHKTLVAVNATEAFRYRVDGDRVAVYDRIDVSSTVARPDGSFGFSHIEFDPELSVFHEACKAELGRVLKTPGLFTRDFPNDNLIHFSALPWVDFTSLSHARHYALADSCPKISIGKMTMGTDGRKTMAVSVHVHHAVADGLHVGQFLERFQAEMAR